MITTITSIIDKEDKKDFKNLCPSLGLSTSEAINIFIKETINEQGIPFHLKGDPFYSPVNQKRLKKNIEEMKKTGGEVHELVSDI